MKKIHYIIALLTFLFASVSSYSQRVSEQEFQEYKSKALMYFNKGDYKACIFYSEAAMKPDEFTRMYRYNGQLVYNLGISYYKIGKKGKFKKQVRRLYRANDYEIAKKLELYPLIIKEMKKLSSKKNKD